MSEFKAEKLEEMKWKFKDQNIESQEVKAEISEISEFNDQKLEKRSLNMKKKLKKRMTNVKQDILRCLWLRSRIS